MRRLLAIAILGAASLGSASETIPFIADDYPKAVAQAKAKNVPIFVEAWAPW
jgi:hypothetical protein